MRFFSLKCVSIKVHDIAIHTAEDGCATKWQRKQIKIQKKKKKLPIFDHFSPTKRVISHSPT